MQKVQTKTFYAKFKIATCMTSMVWNMTLVLLIFFVWLLFLISFPGDWQLNIRQQTWSSFSSLSCYALLQAQTKKKLASWKDSNNSAVVTLLSNIHRGNQLPKGLFKLQRLRVLHLLSSLDECSQQTCSLQIKPQTQRSNTSSFLLFIFVGIFNPSSINQIKKHVIFENY